MIPRDVPAVTQQMSRNRNKLPKLPLLRHSPVSHKALPCGGQFCSQNSDDDVSFAHICAQGIVMVMFFKSASQTLMCVKSHGDLVNI